MFVWPQTTYLTSLKKIVENWNILKFFEFFRPKTNTKANRVVHYNIHKHVKYYPASCKKHMYLSPKPNNSFHWKLLNFPKVDVFATISK